MTTNKPVSNTEEWGEFAVRTEFQEEITESIRDILISLAEGRFEFSCSRSEGLNNQQSEALEKIVETVSDSIGDYFICKDEE